MSIEEKVTIINDWLFRHPRFQVRIELITLFNDVGIIIFKDHQSIDASLGNKLEPLLDHVIHRLNINNA